MKTCEQCHLRYPNESTFCFVDGKPLVHLQDPRVGTTLAGRYVIEEVLGEGGMATVYRARHKLVDRPCAVKIMNPGLSRDPVVRERFRREAKAAQKLAHHFEVIHRDLKPDNIFLSTRSDGTDLVKLLDFGIARSMQDARLTGQGEVFGTPQYMAPERITSIDAGASSDLYAVGIIFFEMLT